MPLKITLRPREQMIIDGAVVRNAGLTANLLIENDVPILREKDILTEKDIQTPCQQLYFIIQLMYIDEENLNAYFKLYWKLIKELVAAAPSTVRHLDQINELILARKYYQALKLANQLIDYEQEVVRNVRKSVANV
ncbi:MAG: flagellar biosynthesis repressor FlbT [Deltaproteobacteria bacterium]|nr:flagellar biosynthesis repressor FlbT [Deltaproteobacteria bacterium]